MISISKKEAEYMRSEGYGQYVQSTHTRCKHYYLVEQKDDYYSWNPVTRQKEIVKLSAMSKLSNYRNDRKIVPLEA